MSTEKIALFDFCDTMINFQSADAYMRYVKKRVHLDARMHLLSGLVKFLAKSRLLRVMQKFCREGFVGKKMLLYQLKGQSFDVMDKLAQEFYSEVIRPNYVAEVIAAVKKHKDEGFRLFIVSGGFDIYLKYVAEEFGFDGCVSTCLDFEDGKFTGRYKGVDCMNNNKVVLLRQYFGRENLRDCDSVAYSDSKSDIPLLKYCRKGVAVIRKNTPPSVR